jgi:hypothetical protein
VRGISAHAVSRLDTDLTFGTVAIDLDGQAFERMALSCKSTLFLVCVL